MEIDEEELQGVIEGILFVSGDPISFDNIVEILNVDRKTVRIILERLIEAGNDPLRGVIIRHIENKYQMCTKPGHHMYLSKLTEPRQKPDLSQAAYETLAVIAYNGPVTKSRIEQIRGVNSDSCIEKLLDRNLIRGAGRLNVPGRPLLLETTEEFLRAFGLRSNADLPPLESLLEETNDAV